MALEIEYALQYGDDLGWPLEGRKEELAMLRAKAAAADKLATEILYLKELLEEAGGMIDMGNSNSYEEVMAMDEKIKKAVKVTE